MVKKLGCRELQTSLSCGSACWRQDAHAGPLGRPCLCQPGTQWGGSRAKARPHCLPAPIPILAASPDQKPAGTGVPARHLSRGSHTGRPRGRAWRGQQAVTRHLTCPPVGPQSRCPGPGPPLNRRKVRFSKVKYHGQGHVGLKPPRSDSNVLSGQSQTSCWVSGLIQLSPPVTSDLLGLADDDSNVLTISPSSLCPRNLGTDEESLAGHRNSRQARAGWGQNPGEGERASVFEGQEGAMGGKPPGLLTDSCSRDTLPTDRPCPRGAVCPRDCQVTDRWGQEDELGGDAASTAGWSGAGGCVFVWPSAPLDTPSCALLSKTPVTKVGIAW